MKKLTILSAFALSLVGLFGTTFAYGPQKSMSAEEFAQFKTIVAQSTTFADFQTSMKVIREKKRTTRENFRKNTQRAVEKITNGTVVTLTSEDAATIAHLQKKSENPPHTKKENISHVFEKLTNGVKITVTSTDSQMVEKIQRKAERKPGEKGGQGHHKDGNYDQKKHYEKGKKRRHSEDEHEGFQNRFKKFFRERFGN